MRIPKLILAAAALAVGVTSPAPAAVYRAVPNPPPCYAADRIVTPDVAWRAPGAVLCQVNRERRMRGTPPLRPLWRLGQDARAYVMQMAAQHFFSHVSPRGSTFLGRARAAGYGPISALGENLGVGQGAGATPAALVAGWMVSPLHRANVLSRRFAEAGVAVIAITPWGTSGATWAMEFGRRG